MTVQPAVPDRIDDPSTSVDELASRLLRAQAERTTLAPLTGEYPTLDTATAYCIQDEALSQRIERGETVVGVKLGLTSPAKQRQMGVSAPLTAWLTDAMALPTGTPLPQDLLIHPRVEPEITFVMGRRLTGPGVTAAAALAAVDRVYASVEIIDSRYRDFRFTLPEVIADNASAAYFVTGSVGADPASLNLPLEACLLEIDGGLAATGVGAAVQGHPAEALAMAANALAERGHAIEAGWIVMTGGMTDAVAAPRGSTIAAHFTHLGSVGLAC
ncbi:4-oxalocrotonate decarboxylase [Nocardia sp. NPDC050793]|uniref:2-keto-4-pentenoate hydratase n=1 Tax=Nocardia sp. NPDC050793 TaxID=3155159 RepID=UPI00340537B2